VLSISVLVLSVKWFSVASPGPAGNFCFFESLALSMGRSELYNTCATALAALVLVAVWWSRHHGASTREVRSHSEQQTAGDREDKKAMEKKEKSERKEAKYARTRAAAEQRVNELTSRLNAARSSLSPQAAPLVLGAVDVEAWEGNSKLITEIGLAFFVVEGARSTFRHRHIIVQEHLTLRNGTFVEDNRGRSTECARPFTHARWYTHTASCTRAHTYPSWSLVF
jgi:hypothetical protein